MYFICLLTVYKLLLYVCCIVHRVVVSYLLHNNSKRTHNIMNKYNIYIFFSVSVV